VRPRTWRFRPDDAFIFEDYDDVSLRGILLAKAAAAGLAVPGGGGRSNCAAGSPWGAICAWLKRRVL
jgi:hypothetical protein